MVCDKQRRDNWRRLALDHPATQALRGFPALGIFKPAVTSLSKAFEKIGAPQASFSRARQRLRNDGA